MDTKRAELVITRNGVTSTYTPRVIGDAIPIIPDFDPNIGLYFDENSPYRVARVRHDILMRDTGMDLSQTGETVVWRYYKKHKDSDEWFIDTRSKIVFNIEHVPGWVDLFRSDTFLGALIWSFWVLPGAGHFDTGYPAYTSTTYGGNVHIVENENIGGYALVRTLNFYATPPADLSYEKYPHFVTKHVVIGRSATVDPYWIVNQRNGDMPWPAVTDGQVALELEDLEFTRRPPYDAEIRGQSTRVLALCYRGSNTYARIPQGWTCVEEMENTGRGSYLDRRTYITPWTDTCPPPMKYWKRTATFWEKVLQILTRIKTGIISSWSSE